MASIGAISCTFVRGEPTSLKRVLTVWHMPGINGYGVQWGALGDAQGRLRVVLFSTQAAVLSWYASLQAAQGTIVTVTSDLAAYNYCLVARVGPLEVTAAYIPNSGGITTRGSVELEIVRTGA